MKNFLEKLKNRWSTFSSDHPYSSKTFLGALGVGGAGSALTGVGIHAAMTSTAGAGTYGAWAMIGASIIIGTVTVVATAAITVVGGGLFLYEKHKNKAIETTTNVAGQTVQGPRWALKRLRKAQGKIQKIANDFNQSSEKISAVIADQSKTIDQVKVLSDTEGYKFFIPQNVRVSK